MSEQRNVIIIGGGPSGFTAGIYSARANLEPLLFVGKDLGGQLSFTTDIENFPGLEEGVTGPLLMDVMKRQAERFGCEVRVETVTEVELREPPFKLKTDAGEYEAKAVIICTGSSARMLGIPSEQKFFGHGVSTCATCDGFFYRGKVVGIVGGGDSAMEEGTFLTKFASKVYIIHRRKGFRASQIMLDRATSNEKIEFVLDSTVSEMLGEDKVTGVRLHNTQTGQESTLDLDGLFITIGHVPNSEVFKGQLEMDEEGYIITDRKQHTSVQGVFCAGDVQDHVFRQAVTAAGTGCAAAIEAERYLAKLGD
ncbi:MAG: thioredoxin-disulfide reductase [Armatimonadetes bacterium CG2_30_59_28]|nr:thioredoxin-disulfide reductase [Armatimonadota bacterium]OIO90782.1 MAG: thioredoxin-disulfide reductase [Armatimonadetes bacterium CG2_30_59_28]PIU67537.1 MAG: thioredoxin-disulfide reductase [Armatimonadetes bacterium CG07_land_8_20_14_0_80_59_28]PIX45110.1 MAG: thioredoxin-disulfide reductase [Armatimonadetes bacterium CG_4_8_14_3_um_filter_58_9]PIY40237.1 MAG: thioredoxin-disulfide reductase [Armatimonadetes bacterium CG_4_10_14_3_um_filter_59_10]PJB75840.1 MAG: thioredoxin-disulfide r